MVTQPRAPAPRRAERQTARPTPEQRSRATFPTVVPASRHHLQGRGGPTDPQDGTDPAPSVQDRVHPDPPAIEQLVVNPVHGLDLIGTCYRWALIADPGRNPSAGTLVAHGNACEGAPVHGLVHRVDGNILNRGGLAPENLGGSATIGWLCRMRHRVFGHYAFMGDCKPHPEPHQERSFCGPLREYLDEGIATEDMLREEMRQNHVRHDVFEVLERSPTLAA